MSEGTGAGEWVRANAKHVDDERRLAWVDPEAFARLRDALARVTGPVAWRSSSSETTWGVWDGWVLCRADRLPYATPDTMEEVVRLMAPYGLTYDYDAREAGWRVGMRVNGWDYAIAYTGRTLEAWRAVLGRDPHSLLVEAAWTAACGTLAREGIYHVEGATLEAA